MTTKLSKVIDTAIAKAEDQRLARLPKWAADKIRRLEDSVGYYKARLDEAMGAERPSPIEVGAGTRREGQRRVFLPADERVRYYGLHAHAGVQENDMRPFIDVHREADGMLVLRGSSEIVVQPHTSNAVHVRLGSLR